jgi:glycine betaine/proline transport system substrate-binding protein
MNVIYDIKYLEDPEEIWGSGERVLTVVRSGFAEESPNFHKLLSQFGINADIQNKWVYDYKQEGKKPEVVAEEWIADNLDKVKEWVNGVKSVDGRDAEEVLSEKITG